VKEVHQQSTTFVRVNAVKFQQKNLSTLHNVTHNPSRGMPFPRFSLMQVSPSWNSCLQKDQTYSV